MSATIKAMRLILYTLGFVSMFLVMFMAQRLEKRFQSLEARLLDISFKPDRSASSSTTTTTRTAKKNRYIIDPSVIMEKARKFREYASNAEAILESMETARREEEDLAMSGLSISQKKRFMILGGKFDSSAIQAATVNVNETFAAIAAQVAEQQVKERKKQQDILLGNELKNIEAKVAKAEANVEVLHTVHNITNLERQKREAILDEIRLADQEENFEKMALELESEGATDHKPGDNQPRLFAKDHPFEKYNKDGTSTKDNVLVVIISNRRDGVITTVASILHTTVQKVDFVLIGEHEMNEQVRQHFGDRINHFISMSVKDVEDDLAAQGYNPIWTWPEWHTSLDPSWKNENTLHIGSWDNLMTHAHVLNHIRFYLPLCSVFKGRPYFYFLDDDILVQRDLGILAEKTLAVLPSERGLVCACNIWMWNSQCFHFEFQSKKDYILQMPSLYGDRGVCQTEFETHCVPSNYWDWIHSLLPKGGESQHAWNFGFSLFQIDHWVQNSLTEKYEHVMKQSYERHVFPETSLTFGLGVAYIAFAGAVECWKEEFVQVRDGFGFIEWDRYAKTFGDDFFSKVDIVHYTGPDKPWVEDSRIEQRALNPWLRVMERESMAIPRQLPLQPTNNLFTVLAGDRAGAQWIMSVLDSHPEVCASGEADKPETGFAADALLPSGLPWYPYCSIKRQCSLEFYKKHVNEIIKDMNSNGIPKRCSPGYDSSNDEIVDHLKRMCTVIKRLRGDFSDGAIARVWVDGFIAEDRSVTGCGCVRGVKAKGLKVLSEWITYRGYPDEVIEPPQVNLNQTKVVGSKIIRLKRRNTWARYKSMMMAVATERFHPLSFGEKQDQLSLMKSMEVDVHHLDWHLRNFQAIDRAGDEWAMEHASEILWLDYEDCRLHTADCFIKIYEFIGVDPSFVTGKHKALYASTFAEMDSKDATLDFVSNRGEIKEVLGGNGWGHMIRGETYTPIQIMMYHTEEMFLRTFQCIGTNTILFGNDPKAEGYGNKFKAALPYLRSMDPDALVVLCDDRDCWTNFPVTEKTYDSYRIFRENFENITSDKLGAVVASAEVECCPTALTQVSPGELFNENGARKMRACLSGEQNCLWGSDSKASQWKDFMTALATKRGSKSSRVFLDATVLVGKAKDLIDLINKIDVRSNEDDRAVLADYMYRFPNKLLLDYDQRILGQAREGIDVVRNPACPSWHKNGNSKALAETRRLDFLSETIPETRPLFLFSPRYHGCDEFKKPVPDPYPTWDEKGILLQPILNHINRVLNEEEMIVLLPMYGRVPDYRQGPEVPYIVDDKGMWTSSVIRGRTDKSTLTWRMSPTEENKARSLQLLMNEMQNNPNNSRWKALTKNIQSGVGFFYWGWFGDYKTCNYKNRDEDSIPILTTCASRYCDHAFPIPNYMNIIDSQATSQNWRGVFREFESKFPWKSKISKIIWRGALSEAEWRDALTSVRWRVNKLVTQYTLNGSNLYDVGLTGIPRWLTTRVKFNITEVGGFLPGMSPMTTYMNYKAILDMDGNSWSSRFGTLLCYNSVVLKIEPKYFEYFYPELKPWKHFIPVKNDLSDFDTHVKWALDPKNEKAVRDIIESANDWCSRRLLPDEFARDQLDIWESYVRLLDRADPNWTKTFSQAKKDLFARKDFNVTNIAAPNLLLQE